MSACDIRPVGKPVVWKDDGTPGWNCDQKTRCLTCRGIDFDRLAEDVTWDQAMEASRNALPTPAPTQPSKGDKL